MNPTPQPVQLSLSPAPKSPQAAKGNETVITNDLQTHSFKHITTGRVWCALATLATLIMLMYTGVARAGTYLMYQCSASAPSVADGWSVFKAETQANASVVNTCPSGGRLGIYVYTDGQAGAVTESGDAGSEVGLKLDVPASAPSVTIRALKARVIGSSVTGDRAYLIFDTDTSQLSIAELPYGSGEYDTTETWTFPQGERGFLLHVNCTTSNGSPTCDFADNTAVPALSEMTLTLEDNTPPSIAAATGELASAAAAKATVSGTQTFGFTATDANAGVLSATLTLTPKAGGTASTHTFEFASQCTYESWNACPTEQRTTGYSFDTSALKDGTYTVDLSVRDAAGNETNDALGTITAHNAPEDKSLPVVLADGPATVGSQLNSQPGSWSAAAGAGAISYTYQWEDCNTQGTSCQIIPNATSNTYTPAPSDAGHTLRLLLTAADNDGSSTATSEPTATVLPQETSLGAEPGPGSTPPTNTSNNDNTNSSTSTNSSSDTSNTSATSSLTGTQNSLTNTATELGAANGAPASQSAVLALGTRQVLVRSFASRAFIITGGLHTNTGAPIQGATVQVSQQIAGSSTRRLIAHALSTTSGAFRIAVPGGPSRTLEVFYRAYSGEAGYAAQAQINEQVSAGVKLSIAPLRTSSTGKITLSGTVQGSIPPHGAIIDPLVRYKGHWVSFGKETPRTNRKGQFNVTYKFQGGIGRFPVRIEVPSGQSDWPYTRGYSNTIDVTTS